MPNFWQCFLAVMSILRSKWSDSLGVVSSSGTIW